MYTEGQQVVHKRHGVGVLLGYNPKTKKVTIKLQTSTVITDSKNIRHVCTKRLAKQAMLRLRPPAILDSDTWFQRNKRYKALIAQGDPMSLVEVVSQLNTRRRITKLSFGEQKLYDLAKTKLFDELAASVGVT